MSFVPELLLSILAIVVWIVVMYRSLPAIQKRPVRSLVFWGLTWIIITGLLIRSFYDLGLIDEFWVAAEGGLLRTALIIGGIALIFSPYASDGDDE